MSDFFQSHATGLESPASRLIAVTPNDGADLAFATRALACGTDGWINLVTVQGDSGRIWAVAGAPFPIRARRVLASGTTATDIVGLA